MHRTNKRQAKRRTAQTEPLAKIDRNVYLFAGAVVIAVGVAYIPAYHAEFIWDDDDYIELNPLLTEPGGLAEIWNPNSARNPQYYPLVFTTFLLERRLWGLDPTGYHIVNVALHAANAVLLLLLLTRIGVRGAWVVAALFALHPVCVESVAWVTERKNVLSSFFYFLAALSYLRFDATSRHRWFGISLFCFVLALFSKTVAASLPIALGLILWWRRRPITASRLATLGLMLVLGLVMGMITKSHEYRHAVTGGSVLDELSISDRFLLAGKVFWFYPFTVLWPVKLAFMRARWEVAVLSVGHWLFTLAALGTAVALVVLRVRGKIGRGPVAAALFYAVTIFPALGFVNVAPMRFSSVADHFQYLACIGTLLLIVGAALKLTHAGADEAARSRRLRAVYAATVALLALLGWATYRQARVYHDRGTLWADTVQKSPENWLAQLNYGAWLRQQEDTTQAKACFERVLHLGSADGEGQMLASSNLASISLGQGKYEEVLRYADRALSVSPNYPFALYHRGRALWKLGRLEEAETALRAVLAFEADTDAGRAAWDVRRRLNDGQVLAVLAEVQGERGNIDGAIESYKRAIETGLVSQKVHRIRMRALYRWRRYPEAIDAARTAIRQLEGNQALRLQLAWMLATCPDASHRDGEEALAIANAVLAKLGHEDPYAMSILASAQAELGRFEQAKATAQRTLEIAEGRNQQDMLQRLRTQVDVYAEARSTSAPR